MDSPRCRAIHIQIAAVDRGPWPPSGAHDKIDQNARFLERALPN
jgi:hypothetical protein